MKYFLRWIFLFVPINKKQVLRFPESTNHCEVRLSRDLLTPPRACVNQGDAVGNTVTAALAHHSLNASRCIFQWNGGGAWSPWTPPPASSHWPVLRLSVPPVATPSGHGRSIFFSASIFVFWWLDSVRFLSFNENEGGGGRFHADHVVIGGQIRKLSFTIIGRIRTVICVFFLHFIELIKN